MSVFFAGTLIDVNAIPNRWCISDFQSRAAVPRFFFNVHDGRTYPDLQGTELTDFDAARLEAIRFAGALLSGQPEAFWSAEPWEMEVCDDYGLRLFMLRFSAEVMPRANARPEKAPT